VRPAKHAGSAIDRSRLLAVIPPLDLLTQTPFTT
jgi:hypothetical protein